MRRLRSRQPGGSSPLLLGFLLVVFTVGGLSFFLSVTHPHHAAILEPASRAALTDGTAAPDLPATAFGGAPSCGTLLPDTELGGDVVSWGSNHKLASADACCASCASAKGCNVWVFCHSQERCGEHFQECWLKTLPDPWEDVTALQGKSGKWTSGVMGSRPADGALVTGARRSLAPPEIAVATEYGEFRIRLFSEGAPLAAAFVREVARAAPKCVGCKFYRAEPVPPQWGSLDAPDSWSGGRWGPPFALLQGTFMPAAAEGGAPLPKAPPAETERKARPLITRGAIAWAGGGGGPDGFIALADHPEWGHGHTVWGEVVAEDMAIIDKFMRERPIRVENWGSINASVFEAPLPFSMRLLKQ